MPDNQAILLQVLQQFQKPAALSEILERLPIDVSDRTLYRWLIQLVDAGQVQASGNKRGRRYQAISSFSSLQTPDTVHHTLFSAEALAAVEKVRAPLITRDPCGYNFAWLEHYQPNQTFYLAQHQRALLPEQGKQVSVELPAGTYARQIFNRILIDLSYNSSRLEGNTYSLPDTEKLLIEGLEADNKLDAEKIMLLNHKEAIRFLVDGINRMEISVDNIRSLHYLLADGLIVKEAAGQIRNEPVRISLTTYMPLDDQERLEKQLNLIANKARLIRDPFEQSFFLLVHLSYLQAFVDVNKRTARLACNIPLVRHNLVPLSFNDIAKDDYASAVIVTYEQNDVRPLAELYVWSYLRSCKAYAVTAGAIGIDPLRVQYRQIRRDTIRHIIRQVLHGEAMQTYIHEQTQSLIPDEHREKILEDVYADLHNLAPFNIAGMGFSVTELQQWQQQGGLANNG